MANCQSIARPRLIVNHAADARAGLCLAPKRNRDAMLRRARCLQDQEAKRALIFDGIELMRRAAIAGKSTGEIGDYIAWAMRRRERSHLCPPVVRVYPPRRAGRHCDAQEVGHG